MHNYQVFDVYADKGISGKDIINRPQMKRLLQDAKQNKFDVVIVWKLTRFSRSLVDLTAACDTLDRHGISLISITEVFDSSTTSGRLVRSILGAIAQFEREVVSDNVKLVAQERARRGLRTCSDVLGYDLNGKDSVSINESEAKIVCFIYDDYLRTHNLSKTSEHCNKEGFTGKRGAKFKPWSIQTILTRPIYSGYYSFHGIPYKGNHAAIIDVDKFNQVQKLLGRPENLLERDI